MIFFFDESGDFQFPADRFEAYSQAAVICPDSRLADIEAFVADRCLRWDVEELHAAELSAGKRIRVCRYIAESDVQLVAQLIDSESTTIDSIARWRRSQAKTMHRNLAWYREQGGESVEIQDWMTSRAKRADLQTRISHCEFVQATLLIGLVHAALQASLVFYFGNEWREDFNEFDFILDGKLPGKLGAGERFLSDAVLPVLGSNPRFKLVLVNLWKNADPPHPFVARYETAGGWSGVERRHVTDDAIDLNAIFKNGLRFENSETHAGLQLADTVAYVVRWAAMNPADIHAQLAYNLLRPKLRALGGQPLTVVRLNTDTRRPAKAPQYRHLFRR